MESIAMDSSSPNLFLFSGGSRADRVCHTTSRRHGVSEDGHLVTWRNCRTQELPFSFIINNR
jgi:hypothetical protein